MILHYLRHAAHMHEDHTRPAADDHPGGTVHRIPDDADKRSYNVAFTKIREELGFVTQTRVHEGVVEIKQALERGIIESDAPTQYTLQWYRSLLDLEERIKELSLNGKVL